MPDSISKAWSFTDEARMTERILSDGEKAWLRRAEFLALASALVLGIGIGALAPSALVTVVVPLLLIGCVGLAWGMVQGQRLEVFRAEYVALVGAGILGIGIGALAAARLGTAAVPVLLAGCFTLAWSMVQKQRVEVLSTGAPALWERALYWACWVAIATVAAIAIWKSLGLG
jgi:hypothetical protein